MSTEQEIPIPKELQLKKAILSRITTAADQTDGKTARGVIGITLEDGNEVNLIFFRNFEVSQKHIEPIGGIFMTFGEEISIIQIYSEEMFVMTSVGSGPSHSPSLKE